MSPLSLPILLYYLSMHDKVHGVHCIQLFFIIIYLELPHVDQIRQFDHAPHLTSIINFGFFVMDFFTAFVK